MLRLRGGAPLIGRTAFTGFIAAFAGAALLAAGSTAAAGPSDWHTGFSSIVVDAKTGEVIDAARADELRHPASLTKIMTLYLLFSELEAGRLKLKSDIKMSAEAASQPPSKLGLKPGQTIDVEDAIKALITRSANDVAAAVAEIIAGDEDSFARLMTQRARALGMTRTVFKNASGLPDPEQVTTAREMALLALALQDRFPQYYPYFSTRTFQWRGVSIGNHNRLLGRVEGVDGIKTGYTRASGFNLVTNVKRGNRHIVAVVMGGKTGAARDEMMRDLISENIRHASTGPRTAPRFAEAPIPLPIPSPLATADRSTPQPGSDEPVRRKPVRTVTVGKSGEPISEGDGDKADTVLPISTLSGGSVNEPIRVAPLALAPEGKIVTFAPPPPPPTVASASAQSSPEVEQPKVVARLTPVAPPATTSGRVTASPEPASAGKVVPLPAPAPAAQAGDAEATASVARGDWIIQIGAYSREEQARDRLADARAAAAAVLARHNPYTEKFSKGRNEYYRARFAGFDEAGAKRACETLKKNDFSCFVAKN